MAPHQPPIPVDEDSEDDCQILETTPIAAEVSSRPQLPRLQKVAERAERQRLDDGIFTREAVWLSYPDGSTVRLTPGMTIQCHHTGDVLHIYGISTNQSGKCYIRALPFCSTSSKSLANMLDKFSNEVCMVQQVFPGDEPHVSGLRLYDFCVQDLGRVKEVKLIITNEQRDDGTTLNDDCQAMPTMICRWKLTEVFRNPRNNKKNKTVWQAFERVHLNECTPGRGVAAAVFRVERDIACSENRTFISRSLDVNRLYTYFDAFSGSGFASRGALLAGLLHLGAFDQDGNAQLNFRLNFPNVKLWEMRQDQFLRLRAARYKGRIDVLHISFPCKYFSPAHTVAGKNDMENFIAVLGLPEFLRIIRPRIVVIEETSGLEECDKHKDSIQSLINDFTRANYDVGKAVLNFAEHGIPQKRRRLIIIAAGPGDTLPEFIRPTHNVLGRPQDPTLLPPCTIGTSLEGRIRTHSNHNPDAPGLLLNPAMKPYDAYQKQLNTITCSGGTKDNRVYPTGLRMFTIYEMIRLQGGSDRHHLEGTMSECLARVGDAFPSLVAEKIYRECIKSLKETDQELREPRTDAGSTGYEMPAIINDETDGDREIQIITPLAYEESITPIRDSRKRGLLDDGISEIGSDEYNRSTPRSKRHGESSQLTIGSVSPTPGPRPEVMPRKRPSLLDQVRLKNNVSVPQFGRKRLRKESDDQDVQQ